MLEAEPNILNVLIDQLHVESVLLIHSRAEASRIIVHEKPIGALSAYTAEGDLVLPHAHYSCRQEKARFLQESTEAAIAEEQERLSGLEEALARTKEEARRALTETNRNEQLGHEAAARMMKKMDQKSLQ